MNKILFIDNNKIFSTWASKTYQYKIDQIKNNKHYHYFDMDDDINTINIDQFSIVIFGWNACYLSKYYTSKQEFYSRKIKNLENKIEAIIKTIPFLKFKIKFLIIQDFNCSHDYENGIDSLISYLKKYNFYGIITPYKSNKGMKLITKSLPSLITLHLPHHIDRKYFKDWNLQKKYDIFLFGNISIKFYPFRNRLHQLLNKNNKFKILQWKPIRNYFKFKMNISNDKLSKVINQSWLTICTCSKFDLMLGKYFETSMSKSIICGNMSTDGKNIWNKDFIELNPKMSDNEILDTLDKALQDKKKLINMANTTYQKMEEFNLDKFSHKLYYLISLYLS